MWKLQYHNVIEADEVGALRIVLYKAEHACMLQIPVGGAVWQSHEQLHHCRTQRLDNTNMKDNTKQTHDFTVRHDMLLLELSKVHMQIYCLGR